MPEAIADDSSLDELLDYIKQERGFDFTGYKRPTLSRRIDKRLHEVGCSGHRDYLTLLEAEPQEFTELFNTILINVTGFFRDPATWDYLRGEVVPRIIERKPEKEPIRVWSTGCASGEEAYSVAIIFAEALGDEAFRERVKIYGTDVDDDALASARAATYTAQQLDPVAEALRAKCFEPANGAMVVRPEVRRAVIFGRHDLIQDAPISRIDLLLSRNTLIYFSPKAQDVVLDNFHFSLNEDGFLVLGRAETVARRSGLFEPVDLKRRVFAPLPRSGNFRNRLLTLVGETDDGGETPPVQLTERLRETGFELSPLAHIVVQQDGRLAFANARARTLFGLSGRDLRRPFAQLELSYRPVDLRSLIDRAHAERAPVEVEEVPLSSSGGESRYYDVQVVPMVGAEGVIGTSITFSEVTRFMRLRHTAEATRAHLATAFEHAQSSAEELETTNEELQSTNEELETTNEELQSTNEELETMNEELQATNEELETLNDELRRRSDDLDRASEVIEGVLQQVRVALVVVDRELHVEAWSDRAEELWGLSSERVIGKSLVMVEIGFPVADLAEPLRQCLEGDAGTETTANAVDRRGRAIRCRVTCAPLRNRSEIRGAIVVMEELSPDAA